MRPLLTFYGPGRTKSATTPPTTDGGRPPTMIGRVVTVATFFRGCEGASEPGMACRVTDSRGARGMEGVHRNLMNEGLRRVDDVAFGDAVRLEGGPHAVCRNRLGQQVGELVLADRARRVRRGGPGDRRHRRSRSAGCPVGAGRR